MSPSVEIQFIAALTAAACAIPGVYLVLRRMSLMSDAISHSVLLGIVIGFLVVQDTTHPLVVVGAAASGVLTVWLSETLLKSRLLKEDAAIGLVFPALFSIGVILIGRYASDVHIDVDAVLLGELALSPLNRLSLLGIDLPRGIWVMAGILLINLTASSLFYKELKLATFDPALAAAMGFSPVIVHYGLMTSVSITAVGAFDHVGSILVVALMVVPAAAAYLLTDKLSRMLAYAVTIAVASAIGGYWMARLLNLNIAASMATMTGVFFLLTLVFAPDRGLLARRLEHSERRRRFAVEMLLVHLHRHTGTPAEARENRAEHLVSELRWSPEMALSTVRHAESDDLIVSRNDQLILTDSGMERVVKVLSR